MNKCADIDKLNCVSTVLVSICFITKIYRPTAFKDNGLDCT